LTPFGSGEAAKSRIDWYLASESAIA